jgi:cytochrome P450
MQVDPTRSATPDLDALFDPHAEQFIENPYESYRQAQDLGPVFHVASARGYMVLGQAEIGEALGQPAQLVSRANLDGSIPLAPECRKLLEDSDFYHVAQYNVEPPEQTRFRAFVSQWFTPRYIRALEPSVRRMAEDLVTSFHKDGRADLMRQFAQPLPTTIIYDTIGIPPEDRMRLALWHADWLMLQIVPMAPEEQVRCADSVRSYEQYLRDLIQQRTRDPRDDMLTHFAQAVTQDEPVYSVSDAIVAIRVTLAAGHETVTGALGNLLWHVLSQRECWQKLCKDPALIPAAIEEGLRFDPPIQSLNRVATVDLNLGGTAIPAGSRVCPVIAAAGRDPAHHDAPDEFRLDRPGPPRHLAFGSGVHFCIGAPLARLELRIGLETLTRMLPDMRLSETAEIRHLPGGITFHRLAELHVEWQPVT